MVGSDDTTQAKKTVVNEKPYSITNIKTYIPLVLDLNELNYDSWSELFTSKVLEYVILSKEQIIEQLIMLKNGTNLTHVELSNLSITNYFSKINRLADLLANIDALVDDKNLVYYAINGLGEKYEQVAGIIRHRDPLPTFARTQSMQLLEESRLARKSNRPSARDSTSSSPHVLLASGNGNNNNRGSASRVMHGARITFSPTKPTQMSYAPRPCSMSNPPQPTTNLNIPQTSYPPPNITTTFRSRWVLGPAPRLAHVTQPTGHAVFSPSGPSTYTTGPLNDGSLSRYKARLVANERSQQQGIYCDKTFSLVVKPTTIHTVLSLAVSHQWPIHQLDVKNAFLYSHLSETVYMHQPPGFVDPAHPHHVCLLQKSLYGLKQAPRAWFQHFAIYAIRVGFQHSQTDSFVFIFQHGNDIAYLLIYVDDIILTTSSSDLLKRIIFSLHVEFSMTDLGPLNYFIRISAQRTSSGLFLTQAKYAREVLERAGMMNCNPCKTPADTKSKLGPDGDPVCLYMHDPREPHLFAMKRILHYLRGTLDHGLQLYVSYTSQLIACFDADWAGCLITQRSTPGYCVFLGDNLITWSSKRQHVTSRSSAEAEYRGVANDVAETAWVRNLLRELLMPLRTSTLVYCDNVSVVYLSCNPVQHQRTKHIEIDIHFVRDFVATGHVRVLHVPSRYQFANIFTKGLPSSLFAEFHSSLSVRPPLAPTAKAY
uniref:Ribonuclease H-like domain-containing protein n=1 Tax=Tanacetum cinerariifolium TaxID=118510 RepID=A0A6L2JBR8_TANCI|nr:ribonuclease H-like domain-containing protein [Tanacetum cinerariifolium]